MTSLVSGNALLSMLSKAPIMAQQIVDVVAEVRDALHCSEIADIRLLQVESDGERVVLRGSVGSFYYKQLAQERVRRVVAGLPIENAVSVEYTASDDEPDWRVACT
jgi:hypothetical protein